MGKTATSALALAAAMPPVAEPFEHVELKLLYNCFEPDEVETHELEFRDGAMLSDYLTGLPEEADWMLFFNGEEVALDDAAYISVGKGDRIGLILIPLGSDGLKSVLRVVLQVAAIAAFFIPGIGPLVAAAINVAVGLINAFLLTPRPPKSGNQDDDRSYGIDGAKNSATEGIPYPVGYGEYRIAGNFSDCYTENVGDSQYLYLRTVLNDGLIDSVSDIELNEQPITNFTDVQTRVALGTLTAGVNDWFPTSVVQRNKGMKLGTGWTTHKTTTEVDKVRFDVTFTNGLVNIDQKKGTYSNRSVTFELQYRQVNQDGTPIGDGSFTPLHANEPDIILDADGDGVVSFGERIAGIARATVRARAPAYAAATAEPAVEYREVSTGAWAIGARLAREADDSQGYAFDSSGDGTLAGPLDIQPMLNDEFSLDLPAGEYEFRGVDGAEITNVQRYPNAGASSFVVSDRRTRQIRRSFTTERLNRGYYEVQIRRTTAQSTNQYQIDEVYLTDIAEIEVDPVAMRGTANLSLRVKLNEQLNAIPGLTCKAKLSVLQEYDAEGNPTVKRWSANPAWIGLDILCGIERGAGISKSRIDWPAWIEFAAYCDANNITFNGIFESGTNMGDALRQVLRIGHAAPVPFGTRISVAIDRARDPVTVFTQASVVDKSFAVSYLSMQDRSNEFEVTYYDKTDRNKAKTIRYVDPKAVTFNEVPRTASVSLIGVDNLAQAKAELWRMIYSNRLLIRAITFDTFLESINMNIGEVALIQHDMMEWAYNGRTAAGSTETKINLDQRVEMGAGVHKVLLHYSAIQSGSATVSSVAGAKVLIPASDAPSQRVTRLKTATGADYEVLSVTPGVTYCTLQLAEAPTGLAVGAALTMWDTDALVEQVVDSVSQNADGTSSLHLAAPMLAPVEFSNFVFGKVDLVRKPYVLTGISGNGIEKRRLSFMEYHEGVYGPEEVAIPIPVTAVTDRNVDHVRSLAFDYERLVPADKKAVNVRVHWNAGEVRNYAGADLYMSLNGGEERTLGSASHVTEYHLQLAPSDVATFRVVAYNKRGDRAPFKSAPAVQGTIAVVYATLDAPAAFSATPTTFQVDGAVDFTITAPADTTGIESYEVQYRRTTDGFWTSMGHHRAGTVSKSGLPTGSYVGRARSAAINATSTWVEDDFVIVALPGSIMENFENSNDRNGDPIPAPTLPPAGAVEHVINTDGSADVSFEWIWGGDEATIDGFEIKVTSA